MNNKQHDRQQPGNRQTGQPFESDTEKLTNRHMSDREHIISDEEFQNIRVGMTPPADAPTQQALQDGEDRIGDRSHEEEDDTLPGSQKITPWNVID